MSIILQWWMTLQWKTSRRGGRGDDAFALVAGVFRTASVRWRARAYMTGLLAPIERKTAWQLSEATGDPNPEVL